MKRKKGDCGLFGFDGSDLAFFLAIKVPQKEEIVDLDGNISQHFRLMVPKKKKKKKLKQQQVDASKEFKMTQKTNVEPKK